LCGREECLFDACELAVALSHYDLGVIESLTPFERGSRKSPKVGIVCQRGKFLLKRRSADHADAERVGFCHELQAFLADAGLPVARLAPTRSTGRTFLQRRQDVYELFEFIPGRPFEGTIAETTDAGRVLARFHRTAAGFLTRYPIPTGDYHDHNAVRSALRAAEAQLREHAEAPGLIRELAEVYNACADRAEQAGLKAQPRSVIHGDWHPGNMLFRGGRVVGVIDLDAVRVSKRVIDVANGALQFSLSTRGDPGEWPDALDGERFDAFLAGYSENSPIENGERRCIPDLMAEALIAETVLPIAATGAFGGHDGFTFLQMVRRKLAWMEQNRDRFL